MKENAELAPGREEHPLLGSRVRDVASGAEGEVMAVVIEEVDTHTGPHWTRRAYILPEAGGRELPTAVCNIESLGARPPDRSAPGRTPDPGVRSPAPPYQPDRGRTGTTSDGVEGTSMTTVIQPETVAQRTREILAA